MMWEKLKYETQKFEISIVNLAFQKDHGNSDDISNIQLCTVIVSTVQ